MWSRSRLVWARTLRMKGLFVWKTAEIGGIHETVDVFPDSPTTVNAILETAQESRFRSYPVWPRADADPPETDWIGSALLVDAKVWYLRSTESKVAATVFATSVSSRCEADAVRVRSRAGVLIDSFHSHRTAACRSFFISWFVIVDSYFSKSSG